MFVLNRIWKTLLLLGMALSLPAFGQVSLLPEHRVEIDGISLMRDHNNVNRWYYVIDSPRLLERNPQNQQDPRPAFQFMTYQSLKDDKVFEGGLLQFSVSMRLPEKSKDELLKKLKKQLKVSGKSRIDLAPLPFKLAKANLYDAEGKSLISVPYTPGIVPPYITGALPFQMKLTKFGADLYGALVDSGNTGVGVLIQMTYEAMLPPAGFKVHLDYDQTWKYLSEKSDLRLQIGGWLIGADVGIEKTKIREELEQNRCIRVESLTHEKVSSEMLDKYMDPIIKKICDEVFAAVSVPDSINPELGEGPDMLDNCFLPFKAGIKIELKDYKIVRKITEEHDFSFSTIVEHATACGTFIGINGYPDEVKNKLVSVMPLNGWASAYLVLPEIDDSEELNLVGVTISAAVIDKKGQVVQNLEDIATWNPNAETSWKNTSGNEVYSLKFPLLALFKKHNDEIMVIREEYSFKISVTVKQKLDKPNVVRIDYTTPLFDGDLPLAEPVELVENLIFDLSLLDFSSPEGLKKMKIVIPSGKNKLERTITAKSPDSKVVVFMLPGGKSEKNEEVTAQITFDEARSRGKRNLPWAKNGQNLRKLDPSLYFILFDSDWKPVDP